MPGAPHDPPPPAFHAACERWAQGHATPYDTAILTAITTGTPLAEPYDPAKVGFSPITRLPPASTAHLYDVAKNDARARFHRSLSATSRANVITSLTDALPSGNMTFPQGLAAAPACLGLRDAAAAGLGALRVVSWTVPFPAIVAAGPSFCHAARAAGWEPIADLEADCTCVKWTSLPETSDSTLARVVIALTRLGPDADVLPAGSFSYANSRSPGARAALVSRLCLRARVAFGTRRFFASQLSKPPHRHSQRKNKS